MIFLEDVMEIAKTPEEYGLSYIAQRYSEFRDRFFDGDNGPLPRELRFSFDKSTTHLGVCHCKARVTKTLFGPREYTLLDCYIALSNAYDFTKKMLDEVIIHEMIHAYFDYKGGRFLKEGHGYNFVAKCNEINGKSDYRITIKNDDPITLNNGTANRIANDGTVMMIGPKNEESYYICRVNEKDSGWQKRRLEEWLGVEFKAYDCMDGNFKNRFTAKRSRVGVGLLPRETIDNMISENILKERGVVEQDLGDVRLLAWKDSRSDSVHYFVATPKFASTALPAIYPSATALELFDVKPGFDGWLSKPIGNGKIKFLVTDTATMRGWVESGKLVSAWRADTGKNLLESVKYVKGHKNSKGEDAPWTIVSHETGKILSSHTSKEKAEEHLRQMEYYKHVKAESVDGFLGWLESQSANPVMEAASAMYADLFG